MDTTRSSKAPPPEEDEAWHRASAAIARGSGALTHPTGAVALIRFVVFEQRGQVSVVRHGEQSGGEPDLVRDVVARTSPKV